jgi:prepilin-type N-terminal cleavage/methylation domain-containing protein
MKKHSFHGGSGFTLIEMIIVIAVIGIMSTLAISSLTNGATDAREIVARQQQATVQSAVNAWVVGQLSGTASLSHARTSYNTASTSMERLALVQDYLDEVSYRHFIDMSEGSDEILSAALSRLGWHLSLPTWESGSYPKVDLVK